MALVAPVKWGVWQGLLWCQGWAGSVHNFSKVGSLLWGMDSTAFPWGRAESPIARMLLGQRRARGFQTRFKATQEKFPFRSCSGTEPGAQQSKPACLT